MVHAPSPHSHSPPEILQLKDLEAILEGEQRHAEHITKQRDEVRTPLQPPRIQPRPSLTRTHAHAQALGALAELKKENAANAYRIKILVRSLEEAEGGGKT